MLAAQVPGAAHAEGRSAAKAAAPTAQAKEAARAAYTRGQAEFSAGRYETARDAFAEAFAAIPNPIVLLSIAEAQTKLGALEDAIATFQQYLTLRTDAPDRADVEGKVQALAATPASLSVTSAPAGAELELDGLPTQKVTPAQLEVSPGAHEIAYLLHGYAGGEQTVQAKPGGKHEIHLILVPLEVEGSLVQAAAGARGSDDAAPVDAKSAPEPAKAGPPTTALWVTGGIGAAGLITGTVLGFLALKEHSDFESRPTTASADRGERLALFADVGFGVGAMAIVTAAVLYLTYDDAPADAEVDSGSAAHRRLALVTAVSPSSVAAGARLRF
jgi:tetratricopeptide (TPR) repeat protein